jgi:hypothetical protein
MRNVRTRVCDWHSYHGRTRKPYSESYRLDIRSIYGSDDVSDICNESVSTRAMRKWQQTANAARPRRAASSELHLQHLNIRNYG